MRQHNSETRILGFNGKCTFGRGLHKVTLGPTDVIQLPRANAEELLRDKNVCDLTPDERLNPYGTTVPRSVFGQRF